MRINFKTSTCFLLLVIFTVSSLSGCYQEDDDDKDYDYTDGKEDDFDWGDESVEEVDGTGFQEEWDDWDPYSCENPLATVTCWFFGMPYCAEAIQEDDALECREYCEGIDRLITWSVTYDEDHCACCSWRG
jgi:hypothetical protein